MPVPAKLDLSIRGGSGLDRSGYIQEDFLTKLHGLNGVKAFREMADNDPVVGSILYAITIMLRKTEWRVEPVEDAGAKGEEAAEFVEQCLFEDMSQTWPDFIEECLTFLPYGFSVHEIVYKRRGGTDTSSPSQYSKFDDGRIGIRKLPGRPQETIDKWDLQEDGGLNGVWQMLPDGRGSVFIPIEKMLLFRTGMRKSNPEGRSVLRTAYVPYQRKLAIEIAEGRAAMRSAGVVELRIPAEYMDPDADASMKQIYTAYKVIADKLAQDRQGSVVLPSDVHPESKERMFSMSYVSTDGRRPADMTAIIERYDKRIAMTVLADFILLGQQSVGSFALSSDKTALFSSSLEAFNTSIAEVMNRFLLPRLWKLNNFDRATMPKLVPGKIDKQSLDELSNYLQKLSGSGAPLFPDPELEEHLRNVAGLPQPSPETLKQREMQQERDDIMGEASATQAEAEAALAEAEAKNPGKLKLVKALLKFLRQSD